MRMQATRNSSRLIHVVMTQMKQTIYFTLTLLALSGCRTVPRAALPFRNIQTVRLNMRSAVGIMVISDERKGQTWYKTDDEWGVTSLQNVPKAGLHSVQKLSVSPDDKMLAVVTVGEGHPYLEVFDLTAILSTRDGDTDISVTPLQAIDPYPGGIIVLGWKGEELLVSSDMPLHQLDKAERRAPALDPMPGESQYSWHVATDTIRQASHNNLLNGTSEPALRAAPLDR